MTDDEDYRQAKVYALKRLSSKSYLTKELRESMLRKEFLPEHVERILNECRELGYLNDDEWLDAFVRGQISKKRGPKAIAAKLFQKGISRDKIQTIVTSLNEDHSQADGIRLLLKTKYKNKNLSDYQEKQKVIASLARRGYDFDEILAALN